jgi:ABC-type bacteriocin/lantibiotic exporter with double-glycine peptidase domain
MLSGCIAVPAGTPLRERELSTDAVVLAVPIVLQDSDYDCGVSALSMLLAYYGHPPDADKASALRQKAEGEEGLTGGELENFLKSVGFETNLFEGNLGDGITGLRYHLDRGRPLLVAINLGPGSNHFVLVTGYDPMNDWVLLQDPGRGALVYASAQFEHAWGKAGSFTLLATPKE